MMKLRQYCHFLGGISAATALILLGGCTSKKITGTRELFVASTKELTVDPVTAHKAFQLPPQQCVQSWLQPMGSATHEAVHHAFNVQKAQLIAKISVGGMALRSRVLLSNLVVSKGRIFGGNVSGEVFALDFASKNLLWRTKPLQTAEDIAAIGGLAVLPSGDLLVATALGELIVLDAASGGVKQKKSLGCSLRSAPTVYGNRILVQSNMNTLFALDQRLNVVWSHNEAPETVLFVGNGSPAVTNDVVFATYSTGEFKAYDLESGNELWMSYMTSEFLDDTVGNLLQIHASPVLCGHRAFILGHGSRLTALHALSGNREWYVSFSGLNTPAAAGNWLFATDSSGYLFCFDQATGKVRWSSALPDSQNKKRPRTWTDPLLAGGCVVLMTDDGTLVAFNAATGKLVRTLKTVASRPSAAVIVNHQLLVLSSGGDLYVFGE